jgi:hypothetical protein
MRLLRRKPKPVRRYAEYNRTGRKPDPLASVSGDCLRVTIEISVESLISRWTDQGMSLDEARRAFKARVREAVTPELLGQLRADINRVIGEERIHYITAGPV